MEKKMANRTTTFDNIQIGKKFKTNSNITYQKISTKKAKPILKSDGTETSPQLETTAFYNTKIKLIQV